MSRGRIPNLLTLARIVLSPAFILFFWLGLEWNGNYFFAAFAVGLLFEVTDFLDGVVARWQNQVTGFGKIFDPLADSISRFTVFLCLLWVGGYANVLAVAVIFWRDALVSSIRTVAACENVIVAARASGKIKAVCQSVGIIVILLLIVLNRQDIMAEGAHKTASQAIVWTLAAVTAWSGIDYLRGNWPLIRQFARR